MGLNINFYKRYLSCNHRVTLCIAAAAASYYQDTGRAVQTQHSWLHGFSGCVNMIFCDVKSGKRWLYYFVLLCVLHTPGNALSTPHVTMSTPIKSF